MNLLYFSLSKWMNLNRVNLKISNSKVLIFTMLTGKFMQTHTLAHMLYQTKMWKSAYFSYFCQLKMGMIWNLITFLPKTKKKKKEIWNIIMLIIFWDFLMIKRIFLTLQVKRSVITNNKHNINNTSYLTSCQRKWYLGSCEIRTYQENIKTSWNYCLGLSPPPEMKILSVLAKISRKMKIELLP